MEDRPPDVPPPASVPPAAAAVPPAPALAPIPWEDPARPKLAAFFETIRLLYARTREAFERVPLTSDVLKPYLFGILTAWIGTCFSVVWQMMFQGFVRGLMHREGGDFTFLQAFLTGPFMFAFAPVFAAVGILLGSLIYHLFLMILGAGKAGYVATLRVVCYAQAAMLIHAVPLCGSLVSAVVVILFTIVGFSAVHRISNGRAAAAVLFPLLLVCVCAAVAIAIGGAAFLSAMKHSTGQ